MLLDRRLLGLLGDALDYFWLGLWLGLRLWFRLWFRLWLWLWFWFWFWRVYLKWLLN